MVVYLGQGQGVLSNIGWIKYLWEHLASVKLLEQPRGDVQFICLLSSHWVSPALICNVCVYYYYCVSLSAFLVFSLLAMPSFLRGSPVYLFV